jgi:uncharacterized damage-inducible protein DinB
MFLAMTRTVLEDAFEHHVWATLVLMDACQGLTPEQLASPVPGTYGSISDMLRHIVGGDAWYLHVIAGSPGIDEDAMSLKELRSAMADYGVAWSAVLAEWPDADAETDVIAHRDDGSESHAPVGIRLAQVVHHGTDHRSQICTGLTALGIEPPEIDVWAFGQQQGRVFEVPPPA